MIEYKYIKNTTAAPLELSVLLSCDNCYVSFRGCEDVFQCPLCGTDCEFWREPFFVEDEPMNFDSFLD